MWEHRTDVERFLLDRAGLPDDEDVADLPEAVSAAAALTRTERDGDTIMVTAATPTT